MSVDKKWREYVGGLIHRVKIIVGFSPKSNMYCIYSDQIFKTSVLKQDYSNRHTLKPLNLFLTLSLYRSLSLVGWSQVPSRVEWARRRRSAATTSPEAHASASLCYKSFRDTQKGHNTFLSLFSHPSILSLFIIEFLWAPNLLLGTFRKRWEEVGRVKPIRQECRATIWSNESWWRQERKEVFQFDATQEFNVSKQRSQGHSRTEKWIYFLIIRLREDDSWFYCVLVL